MGKDENKTAEQYRKERKARLAKEAKKNSKRNAMVSKIKSVALKVCAVIVAVAIVFGIVVSVANASGSSVFRSKVASVGNTKISSVEFSYYYRTVYNFYYQYASQGYNMGFDASVSPEEQKYTADDETTTAAAADEKSDESKTTTEAETTKQYDTWHDFLTDQTLEQIKNNIILCSEAEKAGYKLDDSKIAEIDSQIEETRENAKSNGYTLSAYLKLSYGNGVNEKVYRNFLLRDALAQNYMEYKQDEYAKSYSADKVNEKYNSNKQNYNLVDYRSQTFTVSEDRDAAATKALAEDFLKKATSSDAFEAAADEIAIADAVKQAKEQAEDNKDIDEKEIASEYTDKDNSLKEKAKYSDVSQSDEDLAEWLFGSDVKSGDAKLFEIKSDDTITSYIVAFCVKTAYKDESNTVNVRHILFKYNEDNSEATDEQKKVAKQKAEEALAEFNKTDKTEESFAKIATEKSEDTGSSANGGLYEDVTQGQMVAAFNDWIFDSSRKTGDTDIVETEYGYHVIYFVSKNDMPVWESTIRDELASEDFQKYSDDLKASAEYDIETNNFALKSVSKKLLKAVKTYIYNVQRNSQNSSAQQ